MYPSLELGIGLGGGRDPCCRPLPPPPASLLAATRRAPPLPDAFGTPSPVATITPAAPLSAERLRLLVQLPRLMQHLPPLLSHRPLSYVPRRLLHLLTHHPMQNP